jgi:PAS domain S-box-containing protein
LTLHDNTDRKKAEEDLRRKQEELVDFVENASVGMHWVGPDGIIQWANRTELELLGYTREEYTGRHIAEFHVEAAVIEDILRRLKSGEAVHDYGARLRCKDGSIRDVLINSNVLWEGNEFIHTRCFTRDITERKRAEEALRESEARFRALFESMDEGYCVVELLFDAKNNALDYRFLEINPAFEKQTGITNSKGHLMRQIAPQHEQQWFDILGSVALTGETIRFESAAAALGRDYDVCAFRVGAPELRLVGIVFNDITERKKAENVVRQSQNALLEADKRKDEFLATLAHELRNPLAPIRNSLHILRMANASDPAAGRVHDMMERQVTHMVRLVDDLLELSRISRGQIELKKERIKLSTIIEHAVEASMPFIENRAHHLAVDLPSEPLIVDGDPVRLSQVFANLLNNAAKYTKNGGRITLSARHEGATLVASIRDTGIGIPNEMLSRVFDMFAQVDSVLRRSQDGLGIGLSLVRSLVAMHGGTVEAHSDGLGRGSEFIVRLPLVEQPSRDILCSVPLAEVNGAVPRALRILVVDDNEDSADTLGMVLNRLGAEVKIAYDGHSALEALRTYRPSVVILDLGMPGMDGHEVAQRVRRDPDFCDLPLIALTGWGQEENRRRTREAGFDHHLVKPVDLELLQALLASLGSRQGVGGISAATPNISIA